MHNAHESPIHITILTLIIPPSGAYMADNAIRTLQVDTQISSTLMSDIHSHSDMFQTFKVCIF